MLYKMILLVQEKITQGVKPFIDMPNVPCPVPNSQVDILLRGAFIFKPSECESSSPLAEMHTLLTGIRDFLESFSTHLHTRTNANLRAIPN